jgi:hypothetical protein
MYPGEEDIKKIKEWPLKTWQDYRDLANFVMRIWEYPDYATLKGRTLRLVTGGWSGNESIIGAIERNRNFSLVCWEMSRRGGLHIYKLPLKSFFNRSS